MPVYRVRVMEPAERALHRLDKSTARRIGQRLRWLAGNLQSTQPQALTGEFAGFYKLRVGDYRVVYEILHGEETIVVQEVGHRREIYRRR